MDQHDTECTDAIKLKVNVYQQIQEKENRKLKIENRAGVLMVAVSFYSIQRTAPPR